MATTEAPSESKKRTFEQGKEWMKRAMKRIETKKSDVQETPKVAPITLPLPASAGNPRMFSLPPVPHVTEFPRILPPLRNGSPKSPPLNLQKEHELSSTPPAITSSQKNSMQLSDASLHHNSSNGEPLMDFNLIEDLPVPSQPLSAEDPQFSVIHLDPSYQISTIGSEQTVCYCSQCAPHLTQVTPGLFYPSISPLPPKDSSLSFLSTELLVMILKYAGWTSTLNFAQTCHYFHDLSKTDLIWRHFCNIYHKSR